MSPSTISSSPSSSFSSSSSSSPLTIDQQYQYEVEKPGLLSIAYRNNNQTEEFSFNDAFEWIKLLSY